MSNQSKPENPAKTFLRRYRSILRRAESLQRAIDEAYGRATSTSVRLKTISVQSSGAYDSMAEDVVRAADATEQLRAELGRANAALGEILEAIASVPDEAQKTVLTLRYVEGRAWTDIQEAISYEKTQAYVLHGRGLWHVNQWLQVRTKTE